MDYEVIKYRPEFKGQVLELQTHNWSADLNAAHLERKYERNPYTAAPLVYLALYDGHVVGMRGMVGARWEIGLASQAVRALSAGDSVVHPSHRNRGLFAKIMRAALQDLSVWDTITSST